MKPNKRQSSPNRHMKFVEHTLNGSGTKLNTVRALFSGCSTLSMALVDAIDILRLYKKLPLLLPRVPLAGM
jgi:hypothetical protein